MDRSVVIDFHPRCEGAWPDSAVVVVDVIRATTTAITGVALGRRCLPVDSVEAAFRVAGQLRDPLLVGELGGETPPGFHLTNSPAAIAERADLARPMVLLSSSGTQLLERVKRARAVYVGCLRNQAALVRHLAARHAHVAVLGAGTRGEFREEDQLCCAWIAEGLVREGHAPANAETARLIARWSGAAPDAFLGSRSVDYLRASGQLRDLDFILGHVDDLDRAFTLRQGEIVAVGESIPEIDSRGIR